MEPFTSLQSRRRLIAIYFLVIAAPCGLFAIIGDLMYFQAFAEEITNWGRREPHSAWFFRTMGFMLSYVALVNAGFLFLFGYARFARSANIARPKDETFWRLSALYNIALAVANGVYFYGQPMLNPAAPPFWMLAAPIFGAVLSISCLGRFQGVSTKTAPL
jgi:hypothetical protein